MTGFESSGLGLRFFFPRGTGRSTVSQPGEERIPAQQEEWGAGPTTLCDVGSSGGAGVQAAATLRRAGRYPGRHQEQLLGDWSGSAGSLGGA